MNDNPCESPTTSTRRGSSGSVVGAAAVVVGATVEGTDEAGEVDDDAAVVDGFGGNHVLVSTTDVVEPTGPLGSR